MTPVRVKTEEELIQTAKENGWDYKRSEDAVDEDDYIVARTPIFIKAMLRFSNKIFYAESDIFSKTHGKLYNDSNIVIPFYYAGWMIEPVNTYSLDYI